MSAVSFGSMTNIKNNQPKARLLTWTRSSSPAALTQLLLAPLVPLNAASGEAQVGSFAVLINDQTVDLREQKYLSTPHSRLLTNIVELSSMLHLDPS